MKLKALFVATTLCLSSIVSHTIQAAEFAEPEIGTTLEDFLSAAIEFSPTLKMAEESLNIGSSRKKQASGRLLPQVTARGSITDNRRRDAADLLSTFDGERFSVQLTQVLFNWQAFAARSQASFIENQLEAEYYGALANLLTVVAESYFNVLQAEDALDSIASELEAVANQLDQIQNLYDRQLTQITDLYQAQASVAAVEAEQLKLQTELALNQEALFSATGITAGDLLGLRDNATVPPLQNSVNYWVNQAKENNHQIEAQQYAVQAANKSISERKGAYMPQVSLTALIQQSNLGFDNQFIDQTDLSYLGLDVTIPLYAGGSNRAAVSEAASQHRLAQSQLQIVELEANQRVRSAYLQVAAAENFIAAARKLLESATLSSTAMQQGFSLGVVTSVDVLNALRDQFSAQRDLQQARYNHVKFLVFLKREAGLLSAEDMVEVSSWLESPN
ncbi:MAG: outer membrane protein [Pseudohongiellaceae bacterium]|jgi:outer membrane protein